MRTIAMLAVLLTTAIGFGQDPLLWYTFDDAQVPATNLGTLGASQNGQFLGHTALVPFEGGMAAQFDGAGDWIIPAGDENAFDLADQDMTVFARVQVSFLDPKLNSGRGIVWKQHAGPDPGHSLIVRNESGKAQGGVSDGSLFEGTRSERAIDDDEPHELLTVRRGNVVELYIDGCLEDRHVLSRSFGSTMENDEPLVIGGRTLNQDDNTPGTTFGVNDDFAGLIDEVRIYDTAIDVDVCIGDLNCDDAVDVLDLLTLLGAWGDCPDEFCKADFEHDGTIGVNDLLTLLAGFGPC